MFELHSDRVSELAKDASAPALREKYRDAKDLDLELQNQLLTLFKDILKYEGYDFYNDYKHGFGQSWYFSNYTPPVDEFKEIKSKILSSKDSNELDRLIEQAKNDGMQPEEFRKLLIAAVFDLNVKCIEAIIRADKSVASMPDENGYDALYYALQYEKYDVKELLLEHSKFNVNTIIMAAMMGDLHLVDELLLKSGQSINDIKDEDGINLLMAAAKSKNKHLVGYLLANKIDINGTDGNGNNALYHALSFPYFGMVGSIDRTEIAKILLEHKADVNQENSQEQTPLDMLLAEAMKAFYSGYQNPMNSRHINFLIENGATLNPNYSPLFAVIMFEFKDTVQLIVTKEPGALFHEQDGMSCIHVAAMVGNTEIFNYLLEQVYMYDPDFDINKPDDKGNTPLYYAIDNEDEGIVKMLLEAGAKFDEACNKKLNEIDDNEFKQRIEALVISNSSHGEMHFMGYKDRSNTQKKRGDEPDDHQHPGFH